MKKKIQLIVLHCTFTPPKMAVTRQMLEQWGRERGWRRQPLGYSGIVQKDGQRETFIENDDHYIDPWEITNGARGFNRVGEHWAYAGGKRLGQPYDTRTEGQKAGLLEICSEKVQAYPWVRIAGHNQLDPKKQCPCFDVPKFLRAAGFKEKNIYNGVL